jgi:hypothetical protein
MAIQENAVHQREYDLGSETRTIEWGDKEDGTVFVAEKSCGDLTEMVYEAAEHLQILVFIPTNDYSLEDIVDRVMASGDDCFIGDFEDALRLWGIPFTKEEKVVPLVA